MDFKNEEFLTLIPQHDLRAVSRLITLSENGSPRIRAVQNTLFEETRKAGFRSHVIGVTGSPGAGKSTLVDQLAAVLRSHGKRVAIIAVDPTSPFTGGAILGDRIRMVKTSEDSQVFIRSMATRGALGGVSRATYDAVRILEAARFDYILIETVGVGQAEVDIVRTADSCLVVVVPGMGDSVQAFKAGILEIADLFIINKSDRDGADLIFRDLRLLVSLGDYPKGSWTPQILKTVAINGQGAKEVVQNTLEHFQWLNQSDEGKRRREGLMRNTLLKLAGEFVREDLQQLQPDLISTLAKQCVDRNIDLNVATQQILASVGYKVR